MSTPAAVIFSLLLLITGGSKLHRPRDTARALSQLGLPLALPLAVGLGVTELIVGTAVLILPSRITLLAQAGIYTVFLIWISVALALKLPIASCGCLGRDDTPPYWGHLVLNFLAIVASLSAATSLDSLAWDGIPQIVAGLTIVVVGTWLAWNILDEGARIHGLIKR